MELSKFTKIYPLQIDNMYVYYNSIRMKPVYLTSEEHQNVCKYLENKSRDIVNTQLFDTLKNYKILVNNVEDDNKILNLAKACLLQPYISVAYFIVTESCNLACRYCFLGNGDKNYINNNIMMSEKTADKAISYFAKQTRSNMSMFDDEKEIIFYGGEPLINYKIIKYIIQRCKYYQENGLLTKNLVFSMITNGTLLDNEQIDFFLQNNVNISISIDGANEISNKERIYKNGKPVFNDILSSIDRISKRKIPFGLSITLTEDSIKSIDSMLNMINNYNIKSISFNILFKTDGFIIDKDYYQKVTQFIIDFYKKAKTKGIYENRIMRKVNAFVNSKIYLSDCAATSGSQIVIKPNGDVGICHGCMDNDKSIMANIDSDEEICNNPIIIEWSKISPINKKSCLDCIALGICGGGCPVNAANTSETKDINEIDKGFCIFTKNVLQFLIDDLYRLLKKSEN